MSDNRRNNNNYDDFDWESFDRKTAASSSVNSEAPLRRRRSSNEVQRRRRNISEENAQSTQRSREAQGSQVKATRKRKRKKNLTDKQIRFRRRLRTTILVTMLIVIVISSGMFVGMYAAVSREIKEMNIHNLALNHMSTIYYTDETGENKQLEELHSDTKRIWVESEEIAPCFKEAIVAIEDERFYDHNGVDIKRTLGATIKYIGAKLGMGQSTYGGSTITQQVIKNITNEDEFKATRKVKEMMRAIALENALTKDEILTLYCNVVYFANNCNGVEAAARTYFNKSAYELNLQEAASIAGITQFPSQYDPIANPENNIEKRNIVLGKMYELGKITEQEHETAVTSPLELSDVYRASAIRPNSYFVDQVVNDVIRDLMKQKNYTEEFATSQVYNGGYKIYATIDKDIQTVMESVFENTSNFPGGGSAEAAMVVIDPYTGQIKGLIGGLGEKTDVRGWNRATQAVRQPGSAIKPIAVYGPAVDLGKITEVDIVTDEKITIGNDDWEPKNSYQGFKGDMTIIEAVARSSNIPAVKVLDIIGLSNSFGYMQNKFHISTLHEGDKNYSALALGGLTQGVTVKEMAAAYGVFVNSGRYITPYTYTKVEDSAGNIILENHVNEMQAMSESAAFITANLLSGPVNMSYGTAGSARLSSGMPAYGKTGTTDDDFDKWFVGFTPYYVGAVWFGFDTPASLKKAGITGNPCVTAWNLVFERISRNQSAAKLSMPASVVEASVCSISGKLAGSTCESVRAYFVEGTQPRNKCTNHYDREQSEEFMDGEGTATEAPATAAATAAPVIENEDGTPTSTPSASSGTGSAGTTTGGSSSSSGSSAGTGSSAGNTATGGGTTESGGTTGDSSTGSGSTAPVAPPAANNPPAEDVGGTLEVQ